MNRTLYNNVDSLEILVRNNSGHFCEPCASLGVNDGCGKERDAVLTLTSTMWMKPSWIQNGCMTHGHFVES